MPRSVEEAVQIRDEGYAYLKYMLILAHQALRTVFHASKRMNGLRRFPEIRDLKVSTCITNSLD